MTSSELRRPVAVVTIASFSVAALLGVLALLGSGDLGEGQVRVLLTTLVVGVACLGVLSCLSVSSTPHAPVGLVGVLADVAAAVVALLLVWGIWSDPGSGAAKTLGVLVVLALSLGQACMLLGVGHGGRAPEWLLVSTLAMVALVGLTVTVLVLGEVGDGGAARLLGVLAILDVLGTIATLAVSQVRGEPTGGGGGASAPLVVPEAQARRLREHASATGRPVAVVLADALEAYLADVTRPPAGDR